LGVLSGLLLGAACSDDPKGLDIHIAVPPEAAGKVASVTVTLRGMLPLGAQDHDWDESGVHIHPEEGRLALTVDGRTVDLTDFSMYVVPASSAMDVQIGIQGFDAAGNLLSGDRVQDGGSPETVHFDSTSLTRTDPHLGCIDPGCTPIPYGQLDVIGDTGNLIYRIADFEAHVFDGTDETCSATSHGVSPPPGPGMRYSVHRFSKAQKHALYALAAMRTYTLYVRGFDDAGNWIAAGCTSVPSLAAGFATTVHPDMGMPDEFYCLNAKAGCQAREIGSQ
jgi:hypothetical protein